MKKHLVPFSATAASLGGFLFGFDTAVISGTTAALQDKWDLSAGQLGFTVSCALIGTIIGALFGGIPADKWGRRPVLKGVAALYLITSVCVAVANSWVFFLIFRMLGGIAVGASSVIAPLYTAEISPAARRGKLVATVQLNIVIGIVVSYFSNYIIVKMMPVELGWRWMLGIQAVPSLIFLAVCYFIPESPRWLYTRGRDAESLRVMEDLWGKHEAAQVMENMHNAAPHAAATEPFFSKRTARPITMAILIAFFSQFAGTNAVLYYAPSLLQSAGLAGAAALASANLLGGTNQAFTLLGRSLVDKVGRRPLVTLGAGIDLVALLAIAGIFYFNGSELSTTTGIIVLVLIIVFIAALAVGIGSVLWVFISEIFPPAHRANGQAVGSAAHWVSAAIISGTFPVMFQASMTFTFLFYAACMLGAVIWSRTMMPETKGTLLEDV